MDRELLDSLAADAGLRAATRERVRAEQAAGRMSARQAREWSGSLDGLDRLDPDTSAGREAAAQAAARQARQRSADMVAEMANLEARLAGRRARLDRDRRRDPAGYGQAWTSFFSERK